jgi:hypothetical protein
MPIKGIEAAYARMKKASESLHAYFAADTRDPKLQQMLMDEVIAANKAYLSEMDNYLARRQNPAHSRSIRKMPSAGG